MKGTCDYFSLFDFLKDMGLKVFTNLHYRKPEVCPTPGRMPFPRPLYLASEDYAPMHNGASRIAGG